MRGTGQGVPVTVCVPLLSLSPCAQEKEKLASLERQYQLVTGGRSFPKTSSALREVSEERGVRPPGLLSCCPEPLSPAGTSLVLCKLCSAAAPVLPSASWPELGAPGCSEPLRGLQRPSPGWKGGRENTTELGLGAAASSLPGCSGAAGALQQPQLSASAREGRARHGCGARGAGAAWGPVLAREQVWGCLGAGTGDSLQFTSKGFWVGLGHPIALLVALNGEPEPRCSRGPWCHLPRCWGEGQGVPLCLPAVGLLLLPPCCLCPPRLRDLYPPTGDPPYLRAF